MCLLLGFIVGNSEVIDVDPALVPVFWVVIRSEAHQAGEQMEITLADRFCTKTSVK